MKYLFSILSSVSIVLVVFFLLLGNIGFHESLLLKYHNNDTISNFSSIDKNVTRYLFHMDDKLNVPFTPSETSHMKDVKNIMSIFQILTVILVSTLIWFIIKKKPNFQEEIKKMIIVMLSFLIFGGIASFFFKPFFRLFHKIFFPQGNWMFPSDSLIIQTYNRVFFQDFFMWTFIYSFLTILIISLVIKIIKEIKTSFS